MRKSVLFILGLTVLFGAGVGLGMYIQSRWQPIATLDLQGKDRPNHEVIEPQMKLLGKWTEIGGKRSIEFFKDGTVTHAEAGLAVVGSYTFLEGRRIKIDWGRAAVSPEICKFVFTNDEMTLTDAAGMSFTWRKVKDSTSSARVQGRSDQEKLAKAFEELGIEAIVWASSKGRNGESFGSTELFLADRTGKILQLTNNGVDDTFPSFILHGKRILFQRGAWRSVKTDGTGDTIGFPGCPKDFEEFLGVSRARDRIFASAVRDKQPPVRFLAISENRITGEIATSSQSMPGWFPFSPLLAASPDGRQAVYQPGRNVPFLLTFTPARGPVRHVNVEQVKTDSGLHIFDACYGFSPDGRELVTFNGSQLEVCKTERQDRRFVQIAKTNAPISNPRVLIWSDESDRIAVVGETEAYSVGVDGKNPRVFSSFGKRTSDYDSNSWYREKERLIVHPTKRLVFRPRSGEWIRFDKNWTAVERSGSLSIPPNAPVVGWDILFLQDSAADGEKPSQSGVPQVPPVLGQPADFSQIVGKFTPGAIPTALRGHVSTACIRKTETHWRGLDSIPHMPTQGRGHGTRRTRRPPLHGTGQEY